MSSIFDHLSFDFECLPNTKFIEIGKKVNDSGDEYTKYVATFDDLEFGLFPKAELTRSSNGFLDLELCNPDPSSISVLAVERLVNLVWSLYGRDSSDPPLGPFTDEERSLVEMSVKPRRYRSFWNGRSWGDLGNLYVTIHLDEEEGLRLSIFGPLAQ